MTTFSLTLPDENATVAFARRLAARLAPGDVVALRGPLGAGKTSFARATIRALCGEDAEVPSPTFTLVQTYDAPALRLWHFDLYRIADASELDELGWEEALADGAALVEWPDRAGGRFPAHALSLVLTPTGENSRQARLEGGADWAARLTDLAAAMQTHDDGGAQAFLAAHGWGEATRTPLTGDASTRRYERLTRPDGATALLTCTPAPEIDLDRFTQVGDLLRAAGLSAPRLKAMDLKNGLAIQEDFGNRTFAGELDAGAAPQPLYEAAVDALIILHRRYHGDAGRPPCADLPAFTAARFLEQVALFGEIYLPSVCDPADLAGEESGLRHAWAQVLGPACDVGSWSLILRDYHPGNIMLLPERSGAQAAGLIDFQDAGPGPVAYDLMSLLQDARRDVPDDLARAMIARYLAAFPDLDQEAFARAFAVLAAVRHARVLGIFIRLAAEQGRDEYLVHLPRVRRLLARALAHPALTPVADWLARHAPGAVTERTS
jgi:N-acetylmuramate 1-kinase